MFLQIREPFLFQGLDQGLFAPSICFLFFNYVSQLKGDNWALRTHALKNEYFDVLKNNYIFWPGIQLLNFYVVPLQHRVMAVNVAALFWNTYLSWKTNAEGGEMKAQELLPHVEIGYWAESNHPRIGNHPREHRKE